MFCGACGKPVPDNAAVCPACGKDLAAAPQATQGMPPSQPMPPQPIQPPTLPTQPMSPPLGGWQQPAVGASPPPSPGQWADPQTGYPPAPPPFPTQRAAGAKPGLSTGAIIGIVAGSLVGVLVLGAAGFFAYRAFAPKKHATTTVTSAPLPKPPAAPEPTTTATEPAPPPAATADPDEYVVVTKAEAKDVVTKFLTLRAAKDIAGSKALCTASLLASDDGGFVKDRYWNPDSWEITKFTPDQMYIHVTSMGEWPSGREATIFSVYREPKSGKVLIDGLLDPEQFPELVTP